MDDLNGQTAPESTRGLFDPPADVKVGVYLLWVSISSLLEQTGQPPL